MSESLESSRIPLPSAPRRRRVPGSPRDSHSRRMGPEDFRRAVRKERERSDRSGRPFSVLFLAPRDPLDRHHVARIAAEHLRLLDDIGETDDHRVAILLPETSLEGARRLEQRLLESLERASIDCVLKSYCYTDACTGQGPCGRMHCTGDCVSRGAPRGTPLAVGPRSGDGGQPILPEGSTFSPPEEKQALDTPSSIFRLLAPPIPWWKRALDILGASVLLALVSPLMALAAVAVRLSSPGPVIFRQQRVGLGGRVFWFYKFRSMYVDAEQRKKELEPLNEAQGPVFKITRDPRITPIGRLLRVTSIDELPQLWNVLKGDMSLVGPRPPIPEEVRQYAPWHRRRLDVPGGLTCIWQVSGRCDIPFEDWMRMDLRYTREQSLALDLALLWKTVGAVLSRRGAR